MYRINPIPDHEPAGSSHACVPCRKSKRRCPKELPECSRCRKLGRACNYVNTRQIRDSADCLSIEPNSNTPPELAQNRNATPLFPRTQSLSAAVPFPALFFLDSSLFQYGKGSVNITDTSLPQEFLNCLGGAQEVRYMADIFFSSVHTHFPVVSKLRLYQQLHTSIQTIPADIALLLLSMRLQTQPIGDSDPLSSAIYSQAKACLSYVEGKNILSIKVLQAALLIGLYELSNAIYPAAYLTTGHCARLGYAMGINKREWAPQLFSPSDTSTELEERCRVWWGVIILDRYVNVGFRNRPFACEDARPDDLLPIDDRYWDQGEITPVQPLVVSSNPSIRTAPFARMCQASHLLSRVLRHINDRDTDAGFQHEEAVQLHCTLQALSSTISHELGELMDSASDIVAQLPLYPAMGLCYSAQLSLYDMYCCIEGGDHRLGTPAQMEMQRISITAAKEVSTSVYQFARSIRATAELGGLLRTTPLVINCLYQAAVNHILYIRETCRHELLPIVTEIQGVLELLSTRWKSAKEYIRILKRGDF